MKINYSSIVAAVLAAASLGLQWFSFSAQSLDGMLKIDFAVYLYMVQGAVNSVPAVAFPLVWFVVAALALMATMVAVCLAAVFSAGRKSQLLLLAAGMLAVLAVLVFGAGLLINGYASQTQEPGVIMKLFPTYAFGQTSAAIAMQSTYSFVWWLNWGFWLAIAAAICAFEGAIVPSRYKKSAA